MANQQQGHEVQAPSTGKTSESSQPSKAIERPDRREQLGRWTAPSPFSMMRRLSEDMDRLFGNFFGPSLFRWPEEGSGALERAWWPQVEAFQRGNHFVVRADVPGLKKEDVSVELRDNQICISGERKSESERTEGEYYRSERSYGSFCRTIPLPEGAKPETASASFDNGVLTIEIEAPEQQQGRRIEIREGKLH
jgi:HSP20 family protein